MTFVTKVFVFFLIIGINEITCRSLPSYIKPCRQNDPKIDECLKDMVENIRPYTSKGIPEMHIAPLDPMKVPAVTLNQGSGSMNFVALFTDLIGYGAKNYQVKKMKANFKNETLEIDVNLPTLRIESKYEVNGQILVLPIQGNGKFVGNFTNARANIKLELKSIKKKNRTFLQVKKNKVDLVLGTVKLHFSNLFNGNKELGDQTNRFINENWKDLLLEIRPLLEDTVSAIILGIVKPVFETYSMEDLFPV